MILFYFIVYFFCFNSEDGCVAEGIVGDIGSFPSNPTENFHTNFWVRYNINAKTRAWTAATIILLP